MLSFLSPCSNYAIWQPGRACSSIRFLACQLLTGFSSRFGQPRVLIHITSHLANVHYRKPLPCIQMKQPPAWFRVHIGKLHERSNLCVCAYICISFGSCLWDGRIQDCKLPVAPESRSPAIASLCLLFRSWQAMCVLPSFQDSSAPQKQNKC